MNETFSEKELSVKALENLEKIWGYKSYRPGQKEAVTAILGGKDCMVLFPTGGGKSLCYQLPATLLEGMTLVISPLIALMQDQVDQLKKAGIRATCINSTIPGFEAEQRLINARNGMYKLLYVSPERLQTLLWEQMAPDLAINLVAIDEAHCISQWGHDFRPAYRAIRPTLSHLGPECRWMALTATATPEVRDDIVENLEMTDPAVIATGFARPNLHWWVNRNEKKQDQLVKAVSRGVKKGSGIVYSGTRKQCNKLAMKLSALKIKAHAYHAGVGMDERQQIQQGWINGDFPVVTATNAFGMGIDKRDCRFVIHYDMPFTLEAYYQEAGRAGRDGLDAYPLLLYREADFHRAKARLLSSYPDFETLGNVYNGLCDELNLAIGSEHEQAEPLSLESVATRTSLSSGVVLSGLRILERLEVAEIRRQNEPRIGIRFLVDEESLEMIIAETKPAKANFLDQLFRQFGPLAFRRIYYLDIPYLEEKLQVEKKAILKALHILSEKDRLLEYRYVEEEPIIRLADVREASLPASRNDVEHYRNVLLKKLGYMQQYSETGNCREQFLRIYFGEPDPGECGHCDNCQKEKEGLIINKQLLEKSMKVLSEPKTFDEIRSSLQLKSSHTEDLLRYLIREGLIERPSATEDTYQWARGQ